MGSTLRHFRDPYYITNHYNYNGMSEVLFPLLKWWWRIARCVFSWLYVRFVNCTMLPGILGRYHWTSRQWFHKAFAHRPFTFIVVRMTNPNPQKHLFHMSIQEVNISRVLFQKQWQLGNFLWSFASLQWTVAGACRSPSVEFSHSWRREVQVPAALHGPFQVPQLSVWSHWVVCVGSIDRNLPTWIGCWRSRGSKQLAGIAGLVVTRHLRCREKQHAVLAQRISTNQYNESNAFGP